MARRMWKMGLAAVLAGAFGATAHGGLLPLSATVIPDGDNYRYTYGVMLTSNSTLRPGDQFVIYDFNGLIESSNVQPDNFSFSTQNLGGNPGRTMPLDNESLPNLVWTYTGDTPLVGQIGLGNFSVLSTLPESEWGTDFVSRTHVEDPNGDIREEDNITHTVAPTWDSEEPEVPVDPVDPWEPTDPVDPVDPGDVETPPVVDPPSGVPEPSTMILLAAGLPIVAGSRYLRNRRKDTVV